MPQAPATRRRDEGEADFLFFLVFFSLFSLGLGAWPLLAAVGAFCVPVVDSESGHTAARLYAWIANQGNFSFSSYVSVLSLYRTCFAAVDFRWHVDLQLLPNQFIGFG